ncbi:MAG: FtsX-like permease family protein [Actinomycetes bacterium]
MFTLAIKNVFAHKMRLFSTAFAVFIGVAFMAGTLIFTDTLSATFDDVLADANREVDAMVRTPEQVETDFGASGSQVKAATLATVEGVTGVADAIVRVSGYAQLVGRDGDPVGDQAQAPAFGFNWTNVAELNPYQLVDGSAPRNDDQIVIDKGSADTAGFEPGDVVTVLSKSKPRDFTVSGVATYGSADSAAGASAILFTDTASQELLSSPGNVDGIAVTADSGTSQEDLTAALAAAVPDSLEVVSGSTLIAEDQAAFDENFGPFRVFILVFAGIAVFVGAFIINNTFSITVAQRSKEMAMLRALGASRRQVSRSVQIEAVTTGVIASLMGILAGFGVAWALRALLSSFAIKLPEGALVVNPVSMLLAAGIGIVVTVVSASLPARRAARVRPVAAMRDVEIDRSSLSRGRAPVGTLVTVSGAALLLAGLAGLGIAAVGGGAMVCFIGVAVLGPILAGPVARIVGVPLQLRGVTGELATRNALRSPKRTARTASALMIGVGLVAFISVFAASTKVSFAESLSDSFSGTHVVDSGVFDARGGISPRLAEDLRNNEEIDLVSETRISPAVIDGAATGMFQAFDAGEISTLFDLGQIDGDLADLGQRGMAVDREYADENGWKIGTVVPVTLPTADVDYTVRSLFDGSDWVGDQFVDVSSFDRYLSGSLAARIYVAGDDEAVAQAAASYPTALVLDKEQFFDQASAEIDQVLGIVYAMLALAIGIALLGITNTLALSIFERTRELGLLRAVGMTRGQVRATIRGEAIIIALFGTAMGIAVGTFFGWATVHALADEGIDTFSIPVTRLMVITGAAVLAGLLAAILPARRAARLQVLDALATT